MNQLLNYQKRLVFFIILINSSSLISPSPSLSASSIIYCSSSSFIVSPNSLATLFKFFNDIFPVVSSSNNLNAFNIYYLGSLYEIFPVINSKKSANYITPFPQRSTSLIIFLTSSFLGQNPSALIATFNSLESMYPKDKTNITNSISIKQIKCFFYLLLLFFSQLISGFSGGLKRCLFFFSDIIHMIFKYCYQLSNKYHHHLFIQSKIQSKMQQDQSLEKKQKYLRQQILNTSADSYEFMQFMGNYKNEGLDIDLQNWSMNQIKEVVKKFKIKNGRESISTKEGVNQLFIKILSNSKGNQNQKVYYKSLGLWDNVIKLQQKCKKTPQEYIIKVNAEVKIQEWRIQTQEGGLFGLVKKHQMWITIASNITKNKIERKPQDFYWLRSALIKKFPGSYIYPLQPMRSLEPLDKQLNNWKVYQFNCFVKSLFSYTYFANSEIFYRFLNESDYKKFNQYKNREMEMPNISNIQLIQNSQGILLAELSQRTMILRKIAEKYSQGNNQCFKKLQIIFQKILGGLQSLTKNMIELTNQIVNLTENNDQIKEHLGIGDNKMKMIFKYLNTLLTTTSNSLKQHKNSLKSFLQKTIRMNKDKWTQFNNFDKRQNYQLNNYLTFKLNLQKKKQRYLNDPTKWQIPQSQLARISRSNVLAISKEEKFRIMFPKQNNQQQQLRVWQAYLNSMYQKSFNIFIKAEQTLLINSLTTLIDNLWKNSREAQNLFQRFNQTIK